MWLCKSKSPVSLLAMRSHLLLFSLTLLLSVRAQEDIRQRAGDASSGAEQNAEEIPGVEQDEGAASPQEERAQEQEESVSDELLEEEGVLVLNQHNFARALQETKFLLVEFYAPWCTHCQALAPEYTKAAQILMEEFTHLRLAKVDGQEERDLLEEFNVNGYPTLKFFRDGNRTNPIAYTGRSDSGGIVKWMQRQIGPSAILLEEEVRAELLINSQELIAIGFFKDLTDPDVKVFYEIARNTMDITFGITEQSELFQKYGITKDTVVLFKKFDEKRVDFPVDEDLGLDNMELSQFLLLNSLELVMEYSQQNGDRIFAVKVPNHILLFINKTMEAHLLLLQNFRGAAPSFKGKIIFVFIDINGESANVMDYFNLTSKDVPAIRFINVETSQRFLFSADEITSKTVMTFCNDVLNKKIKHIMISEEPPEGWDKHPVKILVGKTFEEVVYDETKNVFVEFYAPWSTHSKELEPIWEQLGEKYKDHENIIIAKIDATANEIDGLRVRGFPNLKYFPAGPDRKMIDYTRNRTLELFSKFLDSGGVLPEEETEIQNSEAETEKEELRKSQEARKNEL
ncbi:protein disulfide-isomerase A2 [Microcaecilia unicolor]|uniref:protein disulfide-isomerase n=1 Tax=Microcaecilia unicolor TaxID=1415580 RepID=A0A6P7YTA9_9AMPH|nr:protein disulfide-isomerase A2 [Microcaecilia unicolor]